MKVAENCFLLQNASNPEIRLPSDPYSTYGKGLYNSKRATGCNLRLEEERSVVWFIYSTMVARGAKFESQELLKGD